VTIDSVRFYIGDAWWISSPHPFVAQVLDDDGPGGTPGTVLFTQTVNTPTVNQWYAASPNLSITSGGFYVGWQMQDSLTPPLGVDNTIAQPKSRQGWEFTGANWMNSPAAEYQDLMIRARISDLSSPMLEVILTPLNPPIVIPGNGGRFNFNISVVRNIGPQAPYTVWARIKNPDGSYTDPTIGPVNINTPVGVTVTRTRNQNVPGLWAPGLYTYLGYTHTTYSYPAVDSSLFNFTKSAAADGGPFVDDASCTGEPFPYEVMASLAPVSFDLEGAHPNPFNPSTVIRYQMPEARLVSLKVYDTTGRLVTTLVNGFCEAGTHEVTFDGSSKSSGLYFVRMQAGNYTAVQKMLLLK
jgi:hypothetical protein